MPSMFGSSSSEDGARKMKKHIDGEIKELLSDVGLIEKDLWGRPQFPEEKEPFHVMKRWILETNHSKRRLDEILMQRDSKIRALEDDLMRERSKLSKSREDYRSLERKSKHDLDNVSEDYKKKMTDAKERHTNEQNRMKGQLLVNQSDNDGWADDKLKHRYQELHILITNLVNSNEFTLPGKRKLDATWDTTKFLNRNSKGYINFLLHGAIWKILHQQFFSEPFGFGAFGPGGGQVNIDQLYTSWLKVVTKDNMKPFSMFNCSLKSIFLTLLAVSSSGDKYSIFKRSRMANSWRAATFQSIAESLEGGRSSIAKALSENVHEAINHIMAVLIDVSTTAGKPLPGDAEIHVRKIVDEAKELALQFGIHSAHLKLLYPAYGDGVRISEEYKDCIDGDSSQYGPDCSVDLVTLPGLQRVGDGRADMQSKRTIVPCEIFPRTDAE
jgi:hypothetical protein